MPKKSLQPVLELNKIHKAYPSGAGPVSVLKGVDLAINAGQTVAIVGASGSGKSTLLHIAGLLDKPESGKVRLQGRTTNKLSDNQQAHYRAHTCGFVYQHHHLLRELTAYENVLLPARIVGSINNHAKQRAHQLLHQVGLKDRSHHLPSQLSGGEQQRVAIARALMNKPKLLLADEPTGNLDDQTAEQVTQLIFDLVAQEELAVLLVTHNKALAAKCDTMWAMVGGLLQKAA